MNQDGVVSTEVILMIALSLFLVLVGTRAIRNALYPPIHTVQENFKSYADCGESQCREDGSDSFQIERVQ